MYINIIKLSIIKKKKKKISLLLQINKVGKQTKNIEIFKRLIVSFDYNKFV